MATYNVLSLVNDIIRKKFKQPWALGTWKLSFEQEIYMCDVHFIVMPITTTQSF